MNSRTLTVSIRRPPAEVYAFASNPANLPKWARGLAQSVRREKEEWIVESPDGPMSVRFAPKNELGVLDHTVRLPSGQQVLNPMRVIPNGDASEVLFTLFQTADMSAERFSEDAKLVQRDLENLRSILEK